MNAALLASMNQYIIRPMLTQDIEQVQAIDHASFSMPWSERAYHYEISQNENSFLLVAEINSLDPDAAVVGMIVTWVILGEAHIATLAVHQQYRRLGIAQGLLATALNHAHSKGCSMATLEVRSGNQPAQFLYQKFGFKIVGQRTHYYRDNNEDALIMSLENLDDKHFQLLENVNETTSFAIPCS